MNIKHVKNLDEGIHLTKKILYDLCDKKTVLFLSGGKTPKPLYEALAKDRKLKVGAIGMVDDRYSFHHQFSNESMIRDSGLTLFLEKKNIAFYPILKFGVDRDNTAEQHNQTVEYLFNNFPKRIAILGVGANGHIASIAPRSNDLNHDIKLAVGIDDFPAEIRERVTLTLKALSMFDLLIVLAFGKEKKKGIKIAVKSFFGKELSKKTILITDQPVSPLARRGGKL